MEDREVIETILLRSPQRLTWYTFSSLMAWSEVDQYEWAVLGGNTLLLTQIEADGRRHFMQPHGPLLPEYRDAILSDLVRRDYAVRFTGVSEEFLKTNPDLVSFFDVVSVRANAEYIYRSRDLACLKGKDYSTKRNHISRAREAYQWSVFPLTGDCRPECTKVFREIHGQTDAEKMSLRREISALDYAMSHFTALGLRGILIRVGDQPAAFSIYEPLNPSMMVIHFEKADRERRGLYQIVNQEAAKEILAAGYEFINREEDLGFPGLRKAKLSYGPVEIRPSYTLTFRLR